MIDSDDNLLKTNDMLVIRSHITQMEFEIARAISDTTRMAETSQLLKELGDRLIANDADKNFSMPSIFAWARTSKMWLEPREDPAKLLSIFKEAREQIADIAGNHPSMDAQNILANLNADIADIQYRSWDMEGALKSYRAALKQWESQFEFDSQNQVVIFNIAHNWQNIGKGPSVQQGQGGRHEQAGGIER